MDEILNKDNGAKFHKCDLHIHTPVSECYGQKDIKPEDIIKTAIDKDLSIIAITDHNSEGWFKQISEAAKEKEILVLPGVEITTPHGGKRQVHMLAIFDTSDYRKVDELLTKIEIPYEERSKSDAVSKKTIPEIMELVESLGGLSILSHIDSNCGLDNEMPNETPIKKKILECPLLRAVEVSSSKLVETYNNYACLQDSDAHSLEAIGQRFTLVKMGKPSFEGIRQALGDYESRIRLAEGNLNFYPCIIGAIFEGGFLDGQIIHFNENLNCIIGGKGTGKSTIIELARYALDSLSQNQKIRELEEKQIEGVLGFGKIRIVVQTNTKEYYIIERSFRRNPEISRGNGELIDIDINQFKKEFFKLEAYSQTELLEISRSFESQLKMIDQYIDFKELLSERESSLRDLDINKNSLIDKKLRLEEKKYNIKEIVTVREKLRILESKGVKEALEGHMSWDDDEQILKSFKEELNQKIKNWSIKLSELMETNTSLSKNQDDSKLQNKDILCEIHDILVKSRTKEENGIKLVLQNLIFDYVKLIKLYAKWNDQYQSNKEKLRIFLMDLESEGVSVEGHEDYSF
jgi:hypothetical protein